MGRSPNSPHPISCDLVPSCLLKNATQNILPVGESRRSTFEILGKWTSIFGGLIRYRKVFKKKQSIFGHIYFGYLRNCKRAKPSAPGGQDLVYVHRWKERLEFAKCFKYLNDTRNSSRLSPKC